MRMSLLSSKSRDGVELLVARHLRIDAVQLPEVDPLDAEAAQARLRLRRAGIRGGRSAPTIGAGPRETALGGDEQALVGMQRLADELARDTSGP